MEIECAVDKKSENGPNKSDQTIGGALGEEDNSVNVKVRKRKRSGLDITADEAGEQMATKDEESMAKRQSVHKEMMERDLGSDHHQPSDHKVGAGGHEGEMVERSVGKAEPALTFPVKDGQAVDVDREAGVVDDQVEPVGSEAGTADPKEGRSIEGHGESKPTSTGTSESSLRWVEVGHWLLLVHTFWIWSLHFLVFTSGQFTVSAFVWFLLHTALTGLHWINSFTH